MEIFTKDGDSLKEITEIEFRLEKDLQTIVEKNLNQILGIDFVKSEFPLHKLRIDTLGFDRESNSFVIIEYKRDKSSSVVDQGLAYLSLMLNNKAEFILTYNENTTKESLRKDDVDWSQSKVIFIAQSFTPYQKQAIGFRDFPIELWEVKNYSNKTILFNKIQSPEKTESINIISSKSDVVRSVSREIKTYTEEYHFEKHTSAKTKAIYQEIKRGVMSLGDNIEIIFRKHYIAFKTRYNFIYISPRRSVIHVTLAMNPNELQDPKKSVRDMRKIGHQGAGRSRFTVTVKSQIPYLQGLIAQSYSKSIKP